MPKKPMVSQERIERLSLNKIYIGIDPGQNGGLCFINVFNNGVVDVEATPMPSSERDVWQWFEDLHPGPQKIACIEQQIPRPTFFIDKRTGQKTNSILKSTCLLYGQYTFLRGCLHGAGIAFTEEIPKTWQKEIGISPRKKGETDPSWKNRLRQQAQQLYPQLEIWSEPRSKGRQLAIADSLLIAHFCKLKNQGN